MHAKDQAVFDQFSRVTGIPYPMSIDSFLPAEGLFTKGWWSVAGIGVMLALGWYQKYKAERDAEEQAEQAQYNEWRSSRV